MTATARLEPTTPLLDGRGRSVFAGFVMLVLAAMTIDGALTWVAADEAGSVISEVESRDGEIDDRGLILNAAQRAEIAAGSDGGRLDRELVDQKLWLAVIGMIAAIALTVSSAPGSSRSLLTTMVVLTAAMFFLPLIAHTHTIDIVTTAHGG